MTSRKTAKKCLFGNIRFFKDRCMTINMKNCFSMRMATARKDRNTIVIREPSFNINGEPLSTTDYDTSLKYLGIHFNPNGKMRPNLNHLTTLLQRLKSSPLKPYQKLQLLRNNLLPKFQHQMVLGRISKGLLTAFDLKIRMGSKIS